MMSYIFLFSSVRILDAKSSSKLEPNLARAVQIGNVIYTNTKNSETIFHHCGFGVEYVLQCSQITALNWIRQLHISYYCLCKRKRSECQVFRGFVLSIYFLSVFLLAPSRVTLISIHFAIIHTCYTQTKWCELRERQREWEREKKLTNERRTMALTSFKFAIPILYTSDKWLTFLMGKVFSKAFYSFRLLTVPCCSFPFGIIVGDVDPIRVWYAR